MRSFLFTALRNTRERMVEKMKKMEPFYPVRRSVNVRMRYNANGIGIEKRRDDREEASDHCENRGAFGVTDAPSLATVYSPLQLWHRIYDPAKALERGTLFEELDKPLEICESSGGERHGF